MKKTQGNRITGAVAPFRTFLITLGQKHFKVVLCGSCVCSAAFLLFIAASPLPERQNPPSAWKGVVTTEEGIKLVRNPRDPLYGEFAFQLQEDLKIGDPTRDDYYFPRGVSIAVDREGNLYAADFGNKRVQMYDRSGRYLRTIGRTGQGPGEYGFPGNVEVDADGNVCVNSSPFIVVFSPAGLFKRKIRLETFLSRHILGPRGTIIGTTQPRLGSGPPKWSLVQLDAEGRPLRTIAEYQGELSENLQAITLHWYTSRIVFAPISNESFCYGFSADYRINVADGQGRTNLIIAKEEKPLSISSAEKQANRKDGLFAWFGGGGGKPEDAIVYPDHRPFFGHLLSDGKGRIYVVRAGSILEKERPSSIDVFSDAGIYLYRMTWSFIPALVADGTLYQVREDKETGEYTIVRHVIKNWAEMKSQ